MTDLKRLATAAAVLALTGPATAQSGAPPHPRHPPPASQQRPARPDPPDSPAKPAAVQRSDDGDRECGCVKMGSEDDKQSDPEPKPGPKAG